MTPHRSVFLTLSSVVALAIGTLAFAAPETLLESKGVALPNAAATVWVREVGVLIFGVGLTLFLLRNHSDSPTMRAVLLGNAVVQIGLLPIEIGAFREGVITLISGIVPNSVLHALLAAGFLTFASRIKGGRPLAERRTSASR
jgi:hypothetical protein